MVASPALFKFQDVTLNIDIYDDILTKCDCANTASTKLALIVMADFQFYLLIVEGNLFLPKVTYFACTLNEHDENKALIDL